MLWMGSQCAECALTVCAAAAQMHCVLYEVHGDDLVDPAVPEHVLLLVVNHVCTDGWSEKVCTPKLLQGPGPSVFGMAIPI